MEYLKNPLLLGIIGGIIAYGYMYWEEDRKHKKNPNIERKPVNYIIPATIAVIIWFIASSYFESSSLNIANLVKNETAVKPTIKGGVNLIQKPVNIELSSPILNPGVKYRIAGREPIKLPDTDVFIDIARF